MENNKKMKNENNSRAPVELKKNDNFNYTNKYVLI